MTYIKGPNKLKTLNRENINLVTDRLIIRGLKPEDITNRYIEGLNDKNVNYYLTEVKRNKQTLESVNAFVVQNQESRNHLLFGLFIKESKYFFGTIRLSNISYYHCYVGLGICIFSRNHLDKGYATEAILEVKQFVFDDMGLHYIEAGVYRDNIASVKLFEKCGFELYSRIADKYRLNERFDDVLMFRAINPDFNFASVKELCA